MKTFGKTLGMTRMLRILISSRFLLPHFLNILLSLCLNSAIQWCGYLLDIYFSFTGVPEGP